MAARKRRQYQSGSIYRRSQDGRWIGKIQAGWTKHGTRRVIVVTAKTEAEAKRKLRDKIAEIETSGLPTQSARTTVKQWADLWLTNIEREVRPKTYLTDRSQVTKWIIPAIGHKRLDVLTPGDIRAVREAQRMAGLSSSSSLRTASVLNQLLKAAVAEGHQVPPRIFQVKKPARSIASRDAIPAAHARALIRTADTPAGSRWLAALIQGMRQGECLGLTWGAVDLPNGVMDVSWQLQALPYIEGRKGALRLPDVYEYRQLDGSLCLVRPKTVKGVRLIPIVGAVASSLAHWRNTGPRSPHDLVWPRSDGRPEVSRADRAAWHALQDRADVRHSSGRYYYLHEARHTTATLLMELGVDEAVRTDILGHSTMNSTKAYQHVDLTYSRAALERLSERLSGD